MNDMKVIFSDGVNRIVETELNEETMHLLQMAGKSVILPNQSSGTSESLCLFMHDEEMVGYALVKWERGVAGYRAIPIRNRKKVKGDGAFEKLVSELFDLVADRRFPSVELMEIFPKHQGQGLGSVMLLSLLGSAIK